MNGRVGFGLTVLTHQFKSGFATAFLSNVAEMLQPKFYFKRIVDTF